MAHQNPPQPNDLSRARTSSPSPRPKDMGGKLDLPQARSARFNPLQSMLIVYYKERLSNTQSAATDRMLEKLGHHFCWGPKLGEREVTFKLLPNGKLYTQEEQCTILTEDVVNVLGLKDVLIR